LTILIPSSNVQDCEDLLVSVLQNRPRSTDVVVVHAAPYHDPYSLAAEVRFVEAAGITSVAELLNLGLRQIRSEIVHILGPQTRVVEGWTESPVAWFDHPEIASVSPLSSNLHDGNSVTAGVTYQVGGRRRIVQGTRSDVLAREHKRVLGPTFAAGFYRRSAVAEVGGFSADVGDDLADVDMALSLKEAGWEAVVDPRCHVDEVGATSSTTSRLSQAWYAERLFWRHARSHVWPLSLICHPWEVVSAMASLSTFAPQLLGRLLANFELGTTARHMRKIAEARAARRTTPAVNSEAAEPTLLQFPTRSQSVRQSERRAA
jgi:hypothetical protein